MAREDSNGADLAILREPAGFRSDKMRATEQSSNLLSIFIKMYCRGDRCLCNKNGTEICNHPVPIFPFLKGKCAQEKIYCSPCPPEDPPRWDIKLYQCQPFLL